MSFRAINWTPNEMVGERKMDQLAENSDWLYQNTPRAIYTLPGGIRRPEGVKLASGRIVIGKSNDVTVTASVRFGNYFSTQCEPLITTGIVNEGQPRIFCVYSGLNRMLPDHRGFEVKVHIAAGKDENKKISKTFYVAWQAMGY